MLRTGGPWTFESCGGVMVVHGKDVIGADCHVCEHPRTEGDGHLIAAAPELLELLQEMITKDEGLRNHFGSKWPIDLDVTVQRAKAAIAKAKGESK